ncbi:glycosyltransferase family 2 protein [Mesorhizobium sp. ANAO-SY3R2]|uniref:glycosyltransferase family 2 protein n=1 Tax=Mesorhizobium sp. ANAO-SY3R2 TaxID=3166644 RepID=UPI00366C1B02
MNEAKNLPHVLPNIPAWVDEIILVDGNSTDDTIAVARALVPDIVVVQQSSRGKGAALCTGFNAASGDIIVTIDADGSADPGEIPAFVGALLAGADFVKGSRFMQGGDTTDMEWYRKLGNWGLLRLVRLRFGGKFTDLCYGYNAFWRDVLPYLNLEQATGFEIETEMNVQALRANLNVFEVASKEFPRIHGVSNLRTFPDGWRVLKTIVRLGITRRTRIPPRTRGMAGLQQPSI